MAAGLIMLTRPEEVSAEYAATLAAEGIATLSEPMLIIRPINFSIPLLQKYQGLIFTSANAVRIFARQVKDTGLAVYTVGLQTEKAVLDAGYIHVKSARGNAQNLITLIEKEIMPGGKPLLHLRGEDIAQSIADVLRGRSIQIEELVMYKSEKLSALSPQVLTALREGQIAAVTFFSKRTAENFMDLVSQNNLENALKRIKALCVSDEVLECVQLAAWGSLHAAETPDRQAMTALIKRVCA